MGLSTIIATSWEVSPPNTRSSTTARWSGVERGEKLLGGGGRRHLLDLGLDVHRRAQPVFEGDVERLGGLAAQPAALVEQARGGDDEHP